MRALEKGSLQKVLWLPNERIGNPVSYVNGPLVIPLCLSGRKNATDRKELNESLSLAVFPFWVGELFRNLKGVQLLSFR